MLVFELCFTYVSREADRDAVIAVHQDKGAEAKVFRKELNQKKRILHKTWESTIRKRTGREIEKSLFLKNYADRPVFFY